MILGLNAALPDVQTAQRDLKMARLVYTTSEVVLSAYLKSVEAMLDGVNYYIVFLASLLHSPCLWKHVWHPALRESVVDQPSKK